MNMSPEGSTPLSTPSSSRLPTSSTAPYVSCIKIDGRPILPPLMTDAKRVEMRRYKDLAVELEAKLEKRKQSRIGQNKASLTKDDQEIKTVDRVDPNTTHTMEDFDDEPSDKLVPQLPITGNEKVLHPQPGFDQHFIIRKPLTVPSEGQATPEGEENMDNEDDGGASGSSSDVFASLGSSTGTFIIKEGNDAGGDKGEDNLSQKLDDENDGARSEGEVSSSDDKENEPDQLENVELTPPGGNPEEREELIFTCKRKRPAFYFDEADEDEGNDLESDIDSEATATTIDTTFESSEPSKGTASSISLNPFLPPDVTWSSVSAASQSFTGTDADNSGARDFPYSPRTPERSPYSGGDENSDTVKQNRQRQQSLVTPQSSGRSSYDVTLSTKVPSSAENTPIKDPEKNQDEVGSKEGMDGNGETDSDKENHDTSKSSSRASSKKHVRKLSYTLECPSDALLSSGMRLSDTQDGEEVAVDVIPAPLSTTPSSNVTPMKLPDARYKEILTMPTPSAEELDNRLEALDRHLQELQVGVEQNKKKHLERYMDDVTGSVSNSFIADQQIRPVESSPRQERKSTPIKDFQKEIENKFDELQLQQQKQLEYLLQVHREQENKLKEDFDRQRQFLLEQFKAMSVQASPKTQTQATATFRPPPLPKSAPITPRNFSTEMTECSSVKSFTSVRLVRPSTNPFITATDQVLHSPLAGVSGQIRSSTAPPPQTQTSSAEFSIDVSAVTSVASVSNTARTNYPASDWTTATDQTDTEIDTKSQVSSGAANTITELGSVGLSKLQARMKALSPRFRNMGGEARSPLLKGVAFPNPLNRSHAPVRVPPKAFEPEMAQKFARVTACVRGYLTRRLLHTDKIQSIIQTIRDTVEFVLRLYEENPNDPAHLQIRPDEVNLHRMLIQQLNGACSSFHGIFFKLTTIERMAIIATDRQKLKAKAMKETFNGSNSGASSKYRRNISTATLKAIERRLSFAPNSQQQPAPKTPAYQPMRKIPAQANNIVGSKTVSSKPPVKPKLGISPSTKRRRLSHYVSKPSRNVSAAVDTGLPKNGRRLTKASQSNVATPKFARPSAVTDQNGNNWKPRASANIQQQNVNDTYVMRGAVPEPVFHADPARLETNFVGAEILTQDVFNNLLSSAAIPLTGRFAKSQPTASTSTSATATTDTQKQNNMSASTTASMSSSRFSIGSNHSGYNYSGRSSTSTGPVTRARGGGGSRKSLARNTNTKPWVP